MKPLPQILPLRYLIVDDDQFTCACITKLLERWGAEEVKSIDHAPDAIHWLQEIPAVPDIVMCDLNMPEMDGIEFMQVLAEQKFVGDIILMSASSAMIETFKTLVEARGLNVLGALSKPLKVEELVPLISRLKIEETE